MSAAVVVVLVAIATWAAVAGGDSDGSDDAGPGPLGMVAAVRLAAGGGDQGAVVLRLVAPSYAGAELAVCTLPSGPPAGTYRLDLIEDDAAYDAALATTGWYLTTGRTAGGGAVVTAHTPTQRTECVVAKGTERLLPGRTQTWALLPRGGQPDPQATP